MINDRELELYNPGAIVPIHRMILVGDMEISDHLLTNYEAGIAEDGPVVFKNWHQSIELLFSLGYRLPTPKEFWTFVHALAKPLYYVTGEVVKNRASLIEELLPPWGVGEWLNATFSEGAFTTFDGIRYTSSALSLHWRSAGYIALDSMNAQGLPTKAGEEIKYRPPFPTGACCMYRNSVALFDCAYDPTIRTNIIGMRPMRYVND